MTLTKHWLKSMNPDELRDVYVIHNEAEAIEHYSNLCFRLGLALGCVAKLKKTKRFRDGEEGYYTKEWIEALRDYKLTIAKALTLLVAWQSYIDTHFLSDEEERAVKYAQAVSMSFNHTHKELPERTIDHYLDWYGQYIDLLFLEIGRRWDVRYPGRTW